MPIPEVPEDRTAARLAAETLQAIAAVELDGGEAEVAARLRGAAQTMLRGAGWLDRELWRLWLLLSWALPSGVSRCVSYRAV